MNINQKRINQLRYQKEIECLDSKGIDYSVDKDGEMIVIKYKLEVGDDQKLNGFIRLAHNYPFEQPQTKIVLTDQQNSIINLEDYQTVDAFFRDQWSANHRIYDIIINQQEYLKGKVIKSNNQYWNFTLLQIILTGIIVRLMIGLGNYSGYNNAPEYGDYECQRHWMELTVNFKPTEWYSLKVDRSYWPLDYPPLSAYHSYLCGIISQIYEPASMEYMKSRGYQTTSHKHFMRLTSVVSDLLIYIPACVLIVNQVYIKYNSRIRNYLVTLLVLMPTLVIIDHGHFQFNSVMMGLSLLSFYLLIRRNIYLCAIVFCLALNFKQTTLFFAIPIFILFLSRLHHRNNLVYLYNITKVGLIVISTFSILWTPLIESPSDLQLILKHIFPFHRGLYQLQVPNFWFCSNLVFKWLLHFTMQQCSLLSVMLIIVCGAIGLPLLYHRPSSKIFLQNLMNISLMFFFFAIHVHEKNVKVPALLVLLNIQYLGRLAIDFQLFAYITLLPLLKEDGLIFQYFAYSIFYFLIAYTIHSSLSNDGFYRKKHINDYFNHCYQKYFFKQALLVQLILVSMQLIKVVPPKKYPYLWPTLSCVVTFIQFIYVAFRINLLFISYHATIKSKRRLKKVQ